MEAQWRGDRPLRPGSNATDDWLQCFSSAIVVALDEAFANDPTQWRLPSTRSALASGAWSKSTRPSRALAATA